MEGRACPIARDTASRSAPASDSEMAAKVWRRAWAVSRGISSSRPSLARATALAGQTRAAMRAALKHLDFASASRAPWSAAEAAVLIRPIPELAVQTGAAVAAEIAERLYERGELDDEEDPEQA